MKNNEWYKKYGVYRKSDLDQEPASIKEAKLPVKAAIHYLDLSGSDKSCVLPAEDILIQATSPRVVYVNTVKELVSKAGKPKEHKAKVGEILKCVKSYPEYKPVDEESIGLVTQTLPVLVNYQGLNALYTYKDRKGAVVDRVSNLLETLIDECNKISMTTDRHNFIYLDSFQVDMPLDTLKRLMGYDSNALRKKVKKPDTFLTVELTKYAMNFESIFTLLSDKATANTTLIIRNGDNFVAISMENISRKSKSSKVGFTLSDSEGYDFVRNLTGGLKIVKDPIGKKEKESLEEEDVKEVETMLEEEVPSIKDKSVEDNLTEELERVAHSKGLKAQQKYAIKKKIEAKANIEDPYTGKPMKEIKAKKPTLKPLVIKDNAAIFDKSMLSSTIGSFTETYVKEKLDEDKSRMIYHIQNAGVIINNYSVTPHRQIMGDYEQHSLTTTMIDGGQSTIKFRVPVINKEGTYKASGVEYLLKKQRIEAPISKIADDRVLLSSYYGKIFAYRSDLAVHNFDKSLHAKLMNLSFDGVIKVTIEDVSRPTLELPRIYSLLSKKFSTIKTDHLKLDLDYDNREGLLKKGATLKTVEKTGVLVGIKGGKYITVNESNDFYLDGELIGDLFDMLNITYTTERGVEKFFRVEDKTVAVMDVLGKRVPLVLTLGYLIGLAPLLKLLNVKTTVSAKKMKGFCIKFSDVYVLMENLTPQSTIILQGLKNNEKTVKLYSFKDFNEKDVYTVISEELSLRTGTMEELSLQRKCFIDPITSDVLELMKEPTDFIPLLLRAVELIATDKMPDSDKPSDVITDRIRGYERIPGTIYSELIKSVRTANRQLNVGRRKLAMADYTIWQAITGDPAVETVKAINPVADLKEQEALTITGNGGFSKTAVATKERKYREKDLGVVSESTPDSGDVGLTMFMAPNAQVTDLLGSTSSIKDVRDNPSAAMSTSMLLSPGSDKDDGKRANMISVQAGHAVSIKGAELPFVRTGYDLVVANRTSSKFAVIAKKPGKVKSLSKEGIIILYDDKEVEGYTLGEQYLKQSGKSFPSEVVTDLKKGDKVKVGDPITYNKDFFIKDKNADALSFQNRTIATVALSENNDTFEDGCSMSLTLAAKLSADTIKEREFTIDADKQLLEFPKIGEEVAPDDKLFVIHTPSSLTEDTLSKDTIDALKDIGSNAPSAKYKGKIAEIEVYYHGSRAEFSPSINRLIADRNAILKKRANAIGEEPFTCEVDGEFKVNGKPLSYGKVYIKILIGSTNMMSTGSKAVFGHQLKATVSSIYSHSVVTDDGRDVDAFFSYRALAARLTPSALTTGMASSILKAAPSTMLELYKK